jgi:hypothetical protein
MTSLLALAEVEREADRWLNPLVTSAKSGSPAGLLPSPPPPLAWHLLQTSDAIDDRCVVLLPSPYRQQREQGPPSQAFSRSAI